MITPAGGSAQDSAEPCLTRCSTLPYLTSREDIANKVLENLQAEEGAVFRQGSPRWRNSF